MTDPFVRQRIPRDERERLHELFHENTKYHPHLRSVDPDAWAAEASYPEPRPLEYAPPSDRIPLPPPRLAQDPTLAATLLARRSCRDYRPEPIPLAALSVLLHHAWGVTGLLPTGAPARVAPSAGARHPLEWYALVLRVDGLAPGAYHYHAAAHALEPVEARPMQDEVARLFVDQPGIRDAAVVLAVGAVFSRTVVKYGERGYRLVLLDAGHALQNVLLTATALGLGATTLGGFLDDELNDLLRLDGVDQNVVAGAAVGVPASRPEAPPSAGAGQTLSQR